MRPVAVPLNAKAPLGADAAAVEPLKWLVPAARDALTETSFHGERILPESVAVIWMNVPVIAPVAKFAASDASPSKAARPIVIVGGQVQRTGAVKTLERLVEQLELPVFIEPFWNDRLGITPSHRCYLGPFTERSRMIAQP